MRSTVHALTLQPRARNWDLWVATERIFGGWCSDDGFCYFGLWMVGLGRNAFSRAVADPDALADTPEVQCLVARPRGLWNDDWPEWEPPRPRRHGGVRAPHRYRRQRRRLL
ncbi:DUF4240 domain-containing protein [Streptomyces sp. B3I8]|uniref:DUF4240 domain-containing protein n=1 Tax=Streptomyces sp. B3I8 TaxID=3042303 RepID=UPI00358F1847